MQITFWFGFPFMSLHFGNKRSNYWSMIRLALTGPLFFALWFRTQLSIGCYFIIFPENFSFNFVTLFHRCNSCWRIKNLCYFCYFLSLSTALHRTCNGDGFCSSPADRNYCCRRSCSSSVYRWHGLIEVSYTHSTTAKTIAGAQADPNCSCSNSTKIKIY